MSEIIARNMLSLLKVLIKLLLLHLVGCSYYYVETVLQELQINVLASGVLTKTFIICTPHFLHAFCVNHSLQLSSLNHRTSVRWWVQVMQLYPAPCCYCSHGYISSALCLQTASFHNFTVNFYSSRFRNFHSNSLHCNNASLSFFPFTVLYNSHPCLYPHQCAFSVLFLVI